MPDERKRHYTQDTWVPSPDDARRSHVPKPRGEPVALGQVSGSAVKPPAPPQPREADKTDDEAKDP